MLLSINDEKRLHKNTYSLLEFMMKRNTLIVINDRIKSNDINIKYTLQTRGNKKRTF